MVKQKLLHFKVSKSTWILFFSVVLGNFTWANSHTDTSKKQLTASLSKNENARFVTLEANVVFPEVLSGHEEYTLEYIEKFSVNRRAYLIRTYNRSKKYFPKVTAVLNKHNLPQELKVLLALESAFNGNAVSRAGAVGYWQIMDDVAREYGLKYVPKQNKQVKGKQVKNKAGKKTTAKTAPARDDRKNFNKSTSAAARYLKDRSKNLDDNLLLMVASYNWGIGNVWAAMKKTGKADPDFWDIKDQLPSETRSYVMNFIALNVIFHNYEKFKNNTLQFSPVKIKVDNTDGQMTGETTAAERLQ
ncbi:MAG: lytic transglycosylase domain-containing protein [Chitinophagaceae bacterium]|nr:lytic transglycosylase domain-containing protein [Chitinophagaceae bacterium]